MKEKNKVKKTLAAVAAVVVAGLMPCIVAASAAVLTIQGSNVEITAADMVAIAGTTYSFDELYAMHRVDTVDTIEMHDKRHRKIIVENVYENSIVALSRCPGSRVARPH